MNTSYRADCRYPEVKCFIDKESGGGLTRADDPQSSARDDTWMRRMHLMTGASRKAIKPTQVGEADISI